MIEMLRTSRDLNHRAVSQQRDSRNEINVTSCRTSQVFRMYNVFISPTDRHAGRNVYNVAVIAGVALVFKFEYRALETVARPTPFKRAHQEESARE